MFGILGLKVIFACGHTMLLCGKQLEKTHGGLLVTELRVVGVGHGPTQEKKKKNLNVDDMLDEVVT
jgi:hypothetical protein